MSAWPDPAFPAYSRSSRDYFDQVATAGLAEIDRTLAEQPALADAALAKGLTTRETADRDHAILTAIRDDLADAHDGGAGVSWRDKIDLLRAEIVRRRERWPDAIAKGLLTRDVARARLEALEGVQDRFWTLGLHMGMADARALQAFLNDWTRERAA